MTSKKSLRKRYTSSDVPSYTKQYKIIQKPAYLKSVIGFISTGFYEIAAGKKDGMNFDSDEVKFPSNNNQNVCTAIGKEIICKCPDCDYRTIHNCYLQWHIDTLHEAGKSCSYQKVDCTHFASGVVKRHLFSKHERLKVFKCKCSATKTTGNPKNIDSAQKGVRLYRYHQKNDIEDQAHTLRKDIGEVREGRKTYKCPHCDYKAVYIVNLRWHIDTFHSNAILERLPHQCLECNYRAARVSRLRKHVAILHERIKHLCCPMCNYKASWSLQLRKHMIAVHGIERNPTHSKEKSYNI